MGFPTDFHWGAASAAYQVEGAVNDDGRGLSVWDMLVRTPDAIYRGHTGNVACDHYHRYQKDVNLMQEIGLKAYRFSVSWSRVIPEGVGAINEKGIGFYDRLIDALLAANIEPYLTLFHWDYPYALYQKGGWLNPDSPKWFADYTQVIVDALSDRVSYWMTLNEPQVFISLGHQTGEHAPGDEHNLPEITHIMHNVLLAHGHSVKVIRERAKKTPIVGAAPVGTCFAPATNRPEDIEAARKLTFEATNIWSASLFSDPMFFGKYPDDAFEAFGSTLHELQNDGMDIIQQPLDFFGCNIYQVFGFVETQDDGSVSVRTRQSHIDGYPMSLFDWPLTPEALYWGSKFFYERYKKPIVVTENGISSMDWLTLNGDVPDYQRIDYMKRYLMSLRDVIDDGVDVRGYMHWSIMDNFEWAEGYKQRFGLIHVDYATQKRTLKQSAYWYRDLIASNGETLPTMEYRPVPIDKDHATA
ncbi:MAG: GH1 family beta-glucosidase [Chloroflexota bacterium]